MKNTPLVAELTDAYLQAYTQALDETHNPQIAMSAALSVCNVIGQMKKVSASQVNPFDLMMMSLMKQQPKKKGEKVDKQEGEKGETDGK